MFLINKKNIFVRKFKKTFISPISASLIHRSRVQVLFLCFFALFWVVSRQLQAQNNEGENKKKNGNKKSARVDHVTGSIEDERFHVKNFTLMKRFHPSGKGELLEIFFDVENITIYPLNLKFFVMAFHEKDAVNPILRQRNPYPTWRKFDFEKENLNIIVFDSIPVINKQDVDPTKKELYEFPDFLDYIKYIEKKPEIGIDFKISGMHQAPTGEAQEEDSYSITEVRLRTNIKVFLYIPYTTKKFDFNYIGIILYDTTKKQTVYRQFYRLKISPKVF